MQKLKRAMWLFSVCGQGVAVLIALLGADPWFILVPDLAMLVVAIVQYHRARLGVAR
jgi:hypothetical protein